jgi:hypothetical protein
MAEVYQFLNEENISKYIYRNNECEEEMFIFEITLKKKNEKINKIRKIKRSRSGMLISPNDKVIYSDLKSIIITAIDFNNPIKEINVECKINQINKQNIIFNRNIFIELFDNNLLLESNYNIIEM